MTEATGTAKQSAESSSLSPAAGESLWRKFSSHAARWFSVLCDAPSLPGKLWVMQAGPRLKASKAIYAVLWLLGAISAANATLIAVKSQIVPNESILEQAVAVLLFLFFVASWFHQWLIYESLHRADYDNQMRTDFAPWVGRKFEISIRFVAFALLMIIAGKIADPDWIAHDYAARYTTHAEAFWVVVCSVALFALFCLWTVIAGKELRKHNSTQYSSLKSRLKLYFVSDFLAFSLWLSMLLLLTIPSETSSSIKWIFVLATFFIIAFTILYFLFVVVYRAIISERNWVAAAAIGAVGMYYYFIHGI